MIHHSRGGAQCQLRHPLHILGRDIGDIVAIHPMRPPYRHGIHKGLPRPLLLHSGAQLHQLNTFQTHTPGHVSDHPEHCPMHIPQRLRPPTLGHKGQQTSLWIREVAQLELLKVDTLCQCLELGVLEEDSGGCSGAGIRTGRRQQTQRPPCRGIAVDSGVLAPGMEVNPEAPPATRLSLWGRAPRPQTHSLECPHSAPGSRSLCRGATWCCRLRPGSCARTYAARD